MDSKIVLGFTRSPKLLYRIALGHAARELGVKIELLDLLKIEEIRWEKIDGLILPGGPDINPRYYAAKVEEDLQGHIKQNEKLSHHTKSSQKRDSKEHAILMEILHTSSLKDLPVLGISRGMQMLAVALGVPLYLDLRSETGIIQSRVEYTEVQLVEGTKLHRIIGKDSFYTFKSQHQSIRYPYYLNHQERWPDLLLSAFSHDFRLVEGLEFTNRPIVGVLFHPEISWDEGPRRVFRWILRESMRRAQEREQYSYHDLYY